MDLVTNSDYFSVQCVYGAIGTESLNVRNCVTFFLQILSDIFFKCNHNFPFVLQHTLLILIRNDNLRGNAQ